MAALELSPSVFSILSALIEEKVGLHYGLLDREILQEKASARAMEAGFGSLLDYYYFLRYDPGGTDELDELVESLVVGETYFFREWRPIEVLVDVFIASWVAAGRRPRIWSAACATGEEPLSLAMLLEARGLLARTELVATDISTRALAKAKAGVFGRRAVRHVPDSVLAERYLRALDAHWVVAPHLVDAVRWQKINLVDANEVAALGSFDAILLRNVLIYFADATVRDLLAGLFGALVDDGVLVVGVSESLLRYGSGFAGEEHAGAFIYRKAGVQ